MSTHYQTMRKPGPSRALTAGVGVVLAVAVVLISLAATHVFDHHTTTPAASQSGGQVAPNGSGGAGAHGQVTPSGSSGSHPVAPSAAVKTLQQELAQLNYYEGSIDGIMGPQTVQAIQDLQRQAGLSQTGTMNSATEAALHNYLVHGNSAMNPPPDPASNPAPTPTPSYSASVAALQKQLAELNYYEGPVNGISGPAPLRPSPTCSVRPGWLRRGS